MLRVENLTKVYRTHKREIHAVNGISFDVKEGEIVGILGPNGAGKTTTIKSILGLLIPDDGKIYINGRNVGVFDRWIYKLIAAVLEGSRNIYWRLTVKENLEFFAGLQGLSPREVKDQIEYLLDKFGLLSRIDSQVRTLSRGMKQKVAVASAFIRRTPILFLDEPTLGMDVQSSIELRKTLKELVANDGRTMLLSSHDMKVVEEVCERVIILKNGKIIANGKIEKLKALFKTSAYEVSYEGEIPDELKKKLEENFLNVHFGNMRFNVELKDDSRIYDLMELLKMYNVRIKSIKSVEPDFERVYIELVKGSGEK